MTTSKLDITIRRAHSEDAQTLSQIALLSKAHWPYPKEYLEKCVEALRIDREYISAWPVFVAEVQNRPVGFFALKVINQEPRLDHLWILPEYIGKSVGAGLFKLATQEAQKLNWVSFRLAADPYAIGFYEKMGAVRIGTVQSRIKPDLFLPHMEYKFSCQGQANHF
jgi:GNAT superfamily N-acetyltransferase